MLVEGEKEKLPTKEISFQNSKAELINKLLHQIFKFRVNIIVFLSFIIINK